MPSGATLVSDLSSSWYPGQVELISVVAGLMLSLLAEASLWCALLYRLIWSPSFDMAAC